MKDFLQPWKLVTLALGIAVLVIGAVTLDIPDWDIPISFIMAVLTYISAPWSLRTIWQLRWKFMPLALLAIWFSVDGCYWIYWHFRDPGVLELMRSANFLASLVSYVAYGLVILPRGSLREVVKSLLNAFRKPNVPFIDLP